jgi:xylan 1,4-beta-xylosidase
MKYILLILGLVWLNSGQKSTGQNPGDTGTGQKSVLQDDPYQTVMSFINPVMPGDHPDMTLLKVGNNFYACGSNFHFTPYLPVLHSTDLVHWREICRVVPSNWSGLVSDAPQAGTWGGVITYFYDSWWIYFSNTAGGGQYFCKANDPAGPWSLPVRVRTTATTGAIGYDNSVFVDDDGTPYMLIKPGQYVNRIQKIGSDGHLTGEAINLDWINAGGKYSWAEGPVMCKRDGWYYYFIAGNVTGGQYVLRTRTLTADPASWEDLGNFFAPIADPNVMFRGPNHITQPFQLDDGTWWTLSHSYESLGSNDWSGQGRQGLLHQVTWDDKGKPTGRAPTNAPQAKPNLPKSGIPWKLPRSDHFEQSAIELSWHFLNRSAAAKYTLSERPGWLTLNPGSGSAHILHKEAGHYYALITRLDFDASAQGQQAGIYLTNGNESLTALLYSGYNNGKKIGFRFGVNSVEVDNPVGNVLWLKVERYEHQLTGFFSSNGISWTPVGNPIQVNDLDKSQPNYNHWVGTSNGLFASGKKAYFDLYAYRDGFSVLPLAGFTNYFGLTTSGSGTSRAITNVTARGGWLMIGGVDLGHSDRVPAFVEVEASSATGGSLELWTGDLETEGTRIATIEIAPTGGEYIWKKFRTDVKGISGQHDLYLRWNGAVRAFLVKNIQFIPDNSYSSVAGQVKEELSWRVYPNPFSAKFYLDVSHHRGTYSILTLDGKIVESGATQYGLNALGEMLPPGFYLLRVESESDFTVIKLLKR